jgi:NAD(P)-dependent dehydrogenase (short-subunit alcohol dehydrogenase family)
MTGRLAGRAAIITGAASGLGAEMARTFSREGAAIVVADFNAEGGAAMTQELERSGGSAIFVETDVSRPADCERMVTRAVETFGKLDIIVNNAGIGGIGALADLTEEAWDVVMDINLKGVFLGTKYAWPALLANGGGVILNTASVAGLVPAPGFAPYGVAKAGVVQLTKITALEGAPHNIRANALCPVWVPTPMVEAALLISGDPDATRQMMIDGVPLGRMGTTQDVANSALFLASDEAAFLTGVALPIDGGSTAGAHVMLHRRGGLTG